MENTQSVISFNPAPNINAKSHRKENHFTEAYSVIAFDEKKKTFSNPVELRIYATKSMVYACLWLFGHNCSGSGSAGGYGYHKASAATQEAINKAGIMLSQPIDGRGSSAMETALNVIAAHLGYKTFTIHHSHA